MSKIYFFLAIIILTSCADLTQSFEETEYYCQDSIIQMDRLKRDRKVLIIGIDGFRSDAMRPDITPFLYEFANLETTFYTNRHEAEDITISGVNWSSILTGVHYSKHQVTKNNFRNNRLSRYPHFFKYIEQANSTLETVSLVHWTPINVYITKGYADHANPSGVGDDEVLRRAENILLNADPVPADVMFLHFIDLDAAGHKYEFHPDNKEYASTLNRLDGYAEQLISIIEDKRQQGEDWMVIVISDHGGEGQGHFDYAIDNIRYTILFLNNPYLEFIKQTPNYQVDIVPTIFDFLGIASDEFNCKADGISLIQHQENGLILGY